MDQNNRNGGRNDRNGNGSNWKGILSLAAWALVLTIIFSYTGSYMDKTMDTSTQVEVYYSDFIDMVEADQVESAWFLGNNTELTEPENIQALTQLHQSLVDNKSENESAEERYIVTIRYMLKDGGTLIRRYPIRCDREALNDPDSDIRRYEALENVEEARIRRIVPSFPVTITNISYGDIYMSWSDEEGNYQGENLSLTDEQVFALYQCIRKDLEAGTAGRLWVGESDAYLDTVSTIDINLEFVTGIGEDQKWSYIYETLCLDEENTTNWIRENTDFTVMTQRELYEEESGEPDAEFIN